MFWMVLVLASTALLAWLLMALRKYERESATAALEEVTALREELEALRLRVQNLEAIVAEEDAAETAGEDAGLADGSVPRLPLSEQGHESPPDSVSSARRRPLRS